VEFPLKENSFAVLKSLLRVVDPEFGGAIIEKPLM